VTIYTSRGDHLTDFSLQELQDKLPAGAFDRVHRKALLNLEQVTRLEPCATGGLVARTTRGHAVEISRQAARVLRKRLGLRRAADDGDD
jgi:two-component system LytT family response regulator